MKFDIAGQDVNLEIPDDAMVTGAFIMVTYQRVLEGGIGAGTVWGHSPMSNIQAVGMVRVAQIAVEADWNDA